MKHDAPFVRAFEQRGVSTMLRSRAAIALGLFALVLFAMGCTNRIGSPEGWAAPTEAGNLVVAQADNGELIALRVEGSRATEVWRYPPAGDDELDLKAIYASPVVDGDSLYVVSYNGLVVALEAATGQVDSAWGTPVDIESTVIATPVLDGGTLYVPTQEGNLIAVNTEDGTVGPRVVEGLGRIWGRPIIDAGTLYLADMNHEVRALSLANVTTDEEPTWVHDVGGAVPGAMLADRDLLLAGGLDRRLYALDLDAAGDERWRFDGDGWFWAEPLVEGDTVYAATVAGTLYAIDRNSGEEIWRFHEEDSEIRARPVLVDGVLVVAQRDGFLFGVDPVEGILLWREQLIDGRLLADPLVLESGLFYSTTDGDLIRVVDAATGGVEVLFNRNGS